MKNWRRQESVKTMKLVANYLTPKPIDIKLISKVQECQGQAPAP